MKSAPFSALAAAIVSVALGSSAAAAPFQTATWNELFPTNSPPGTAGHSVVSDGSRAISFGGKELGAGLQNKIWAFDGADWSDLSPAAGPAPAPRKTGGVAWDSGRARLVVFGGDAGGASNDTWEWDGTTWTQMSPANSPPALLKCEIAYVPGLGKTYLFGGSDGAQVNDQTWSWDGTDWTQLSPATSPPARRNHFMTADSGSNTVFVYGGLDTAAASSTPLNDTWVFDGTNWTEIVTTSFPTSGGINGLYNGAITYLPATGRMLLFGGVETGPTLPSTWEFDGTDWTNLSIPGPGDRQATSMIFVAGLNRTILFGGFRTSQMNDTWEYADANPGTNYCISIANSTGAASAISATGSSSVSANDLVLSANNIPNQPGIFIAGPSSAQTPFFNGFLCIDVNGLQRFSDTTPSTGGVITEVVDLATSAPGGLNVMAGSSYFYQRWYRDPAAGGGNANFSDGLEIAYTP